MTYSLVKPAIDSRKRLLKRLAMPATAGLLGLWLLLALSNAMGQASVTLASVALSVRWVQEAAAIGIDAICCDEESISFSPSAVEHVNVGIGGAPVWIELPPLRSGEILAIKPLADSVQLFERALGVQEWTISQSGDSVPRTGTALATPGIAFRIDESSTTPVRRYLRVVNPVNSSLTFENWDPAQFQHYLRQQQLIRIFLLGFVLATIMFNLVISAIARDSLFLLNALSVASGLGVTLYLSMYGVTYLWSYEYSNVLMILFLAISICFGSAFVRRFLTSTAEPIPRFRYFNGFTWTAVALVVSLAFAPYWIVMTALLVLLPIFFATLLATAGWQIYRGNRNAILILFPLLGAMLPGLILVFMRSMGKLSMGVLQDQLLMVTLAVEALAFSLVLGTRVRFSAAEAAAAQRQVLLTEVNAARRLAEVQDKERERIASDLHDSIGHELIILSNRLDSALRSSGDLRPLNAARETASRALAMVRSVSHALHPAMIHHLGWNAAVRALFEEMASSLEVDLELQFPPIDPDLNFLEKTHLFRVLQEVTTNIAKHAKATNCSVRVFRVRDRLRVEVGDDGESNAPVDERGWGLGLHSIDHRIRALDGSWGLTERAEGGTLFWAEVPERVNEGAAE